tara:strand:- start:587 stop:1336 length:750 start_codon:yes stop_codon:yes gene_type:complete
MRYLIEFSYLGTAYHGWQIQPNANTVQAELQAALSTLHQAEVEVVGAGRTDTGVHAEQMYAHFDTLKEWDNRSFLHRINSILPHDIAVYNLFQVKADFHARFDATFRSYRYQISHRKNPFLTDRAFRLPFPLNIEKMNQAAELLLGEHDFSCFSKAHTQTFTNNCHLISADWRKEKDLLLFEVTANRFLRNMVRAMVGTLLEVGEGKRAVESMPELLESKNRSKSGTSVPAQGLYLTEVGYPEESFKLI